MVLPDLIATKLFSDLTSVIKVFTAAHLCNEVQSLCCDCIFSLGKTSLGTLQVFHRPPQMLAAPLVCFKIVPHSPVGAQS